MLGMVAVAADPNEHYAVRMGPVGGTRPGLLQGIASQNEPLLLQAGTRQGVIIAVQHPPAVSPAALDQAEAHSSTVAAGSHITRASASAARGQPFRCPATQQMAVERLVQASLLARHHPALLAGHGCGMHCQEALVHGVPIVLSLLQHVSHKLS